MSKPGKRVKLLVVRLGTTEHRDLERAASRAGLPVSTWARMELRKAALGAHTIVASPKSRLLSQPSSMSMTAEERLGGPGVFAPIPIAFKCGYCGLTGEHDITCQHYLAPERTGPFDPG